jgi:hypothetical protein
MRNFGRSRYLLPVLMSWKTPKGKLSASQLSVIAFYTTWSYCSDDDKVRSNANPVQTPDKPGLPKASGNALEERQHGALQAPKKCGI